MAKNHSFLRNNYNNLCRTCLSYSPGSKSIYATNSAEKLNVCNFFEVVPDDGLPTLICSKCEYILEQSYNFKQQCEKSYVTLQNLFEKQEDFVNDIVDNIKNENEEAAAYLSKYCELDNAVPVTFKCDLCSTLFKDHDILQEHISENHQEKSSDEESTNLTLFSKDVSSKPTVAYSCLECSASFSVLNDLELHKSTHNNVDLSCIECGKVFLTRQMLRRHIKIHMINKPHVCQKCGKGYSESHALTKHLRVHVNLKREKNHECKECGQRFSEPYYLKIHMRKHTGERPLVCPICDKSFSDPRSLKSHASTHTGEKPFICNVCGKSFSQNSNLIKHFRIHSGEKPYACTVCDKSFNQSTSLEKHKRTHNGEKPYSCKLCSKRFSIKYTLDYHLKTHTKEKSFLCDACGKAFTSARGLKRHERKHFVKEII